MDGLKYIVSLLSLPNFFSFSSVEPNAIDAIVIQTMESFNAISRWTESSSQIVWRMFVVLINWLECLSFASLTVFFVLLASDKYRCYFYYLERKKTRLKSSQVSLLIHWVCHSYGHFIPRVAWDGRVSNLLISSVYSACFKAFGKTKSITVHHNKFLFLFYSLRNNQTIVKCVVF